MGERPLAGITLAKYVAVALCWGTLFLWVRQALDGGLPPLVVMAIRSTVGATALWTVIATRRRLAGTAAPPDGKPRHWYDYLLLGVGFNFMPFFLIVLGETHVSTGISGVIISSDPIWTAILVSILARTVQGPPVRIAGILLGFAGVAAMVMLQNGLSLHAGTLGLLALIGSAILYGTWGVFVSDRFADVSSMRVAAMGLTYAAMTAVPLSVLQLGDAHPTPGGVLACVALGLFGSGFSYALYYQLVAEIGPTRAATVNYLLPIIAVGLGLLLLDESLTTGIGIAMVAVLLGVWMGSRAETATVVDVPVEDVGAGLPDVGQVGQVEQMEHAKLAAAAIRDAAVATAREDADRVYEETVALAISDADALRTAAREEAAAEADLLRSRELAAARTQAELLLGQARRQALADAEQVLAEAVARAELDASRIREQALAAAQRDADRVCAAAMASARAEVEGLRAAALEDARAEAVRLAAELSGDARAEATAIRSAARAAAREDARAIHDAAHARAAALLDAVDDLLQLAARARSDAPSTVVPLRGAAASTRSPLAALPPAQTSEEARIRARIAARYERLNQLLPVWAGEGAAPADLDEVA